MECEAILKRQKEKSFFFITLRKFTLMFIDAALVAASFCFALQLRFNFEVPANYSANIIRLLPVFMLVRLGCFYFFRLYHRVWKYASVSELLNIGLSVLTGSAVNGTITFFLMNSSKVPLPRSLFVIESMLTFFLVGFSRYVWRVFRDYNARRLFIGNSVKVLIVGAGSAGVSLMKELLRKEDEAVDVIGFIDDNIEKENMIIAGKPVLGNRYRIPEIVRTYNIDEIIIAIPSSSRKSIREIVEICHRMDVEIKILPAMYEILNGSVRVSPVREVRIEDLLGREPIVLDLKAMEEHIKDKVVLITGAGGSIGSELCRQAAKLSPACILMLDNSENNMYEIDMEMRNGYGSVERKRIVVDVRDRKAVENVFRHYRPHLVFHAAAHKHVPLMEENACEAVKTNIWGTYNAAGMAHEYGAEKFVLISTDKAVNPTSIMGATKRGAEMIIQHMDSVSGTNFVAVRFGNVLGSRGSVIPLFRKQIARGGPVTVTHKDMTRYFMTIPEAVQLVIQAGAMAKGGEIFVLDMGEQVRIVDLAETLIRLSGFEPYTDIPIEFVGIRKGEKLYEELLVDKKRCDFTRHKQIFVEKGIKFRKQEVENFIGSASSGHFPENREETVALLLELIPEFMPDEKRN